MPNTWTPLPPDALPLELLDRYARDRENAQRRACYARHPERVMRQRLTCAANLLARYGLLDSNTKAAILANVGGVSLV